jgi:dipeptidyl aminopeptidase/acylaminoacyl peptidase
MTKMQRVAWIALLATPAMPDAGMGLGRAVGTIVVEAPTSAEDETDGLAPPPGDPRYSPPQQRSRTGSRTGPGGRLVFKDRITPRWFGDNARFWYRNDLPGGGKEFIRVDVENGTRVAAFDHARLAAALTKAAGTQEFHADRLPFDTITFDETYRAIRFPIGDATWSCDLSSYECSRGGGTASGADPVTPAPEASTVADRRRRGATEAGVGGARAVASPDGKWTAFVKDDHLFVRSQGPGQESEDIQLTDRPMSHLSSSLLTWAPDSRSLVAFQVKVADRRPVYLVQSSPAGGGRAKLESRPYDLPGDVFTSYTPHLFDVARRRRVPVLPELEPIDLGRPRIRWDEDGRRFTYQKNDRGHQRFRLIAVDIETGAARNLIDERTDTFIWSAHRENADFQAVTWLDATGEIFYVSERDGWRHLYLLDGSTGVVKNRITQGPYVVRGIDLIDEENRQVWFHASGKESGQDPYFLHYYRVGFDGSDPVALTEGNGNHSVQFSPDRRYLIDTSSRVDMPPVHTLRRTSDGASVTVLETADITALAASGWDAPEVFVAKGRDGQTDIWGIICRPRNFDPKATYPVIESIYAGPHGSFVPKSFSPARRFSALTDLGFIVVQIDGMGTANRSKAFHDVCWRNLKDAGFPDRILWHRAVAARYPSYDIRRVGIYGTSAGGQNAAGAVLFHPDFYKVAVAACGCHDNRMDKASWNEQWMGYPVGSWYSESSNIDNAHRLVGKLLLIVGEMDTNVPPESTFRFVDALIRAGKDFDLLVVPNQGHGSGGEYGARRQQDFFVRHLLGREPPDRNAVATASPPRDAALTLTRTEENTPAGGRPTRVDDTAPALELKDLDSSPSVLREVIERYVADRSSLLRMLPPAASPDRAALLREFTGRWRDQIKELDFKTLNRDGQVDYLLFDNHLAHELRQFDVRSRESEAAARFVPFAGTILDLERSRRQVESMDWSEVAGKLTRLTRDVTESRRTIEAKPRDKDKPEVKRGVALRTVAIADELTDMLRNWYRFYDGYDPLFTWWMQEPYKAADESLRAYAGLLRDRLGVRTSGPGDQSDESGGPRRSVGRDPSTATATAANRAAAPAAVMARDREGGKDIVGNPIGRDVLVDELTHEMIADTPEELIRIAEIELAWCESEMKAAARAMGCGDDWRAALERVKSRHVEPGKQPRLIRDLAVEAIDYLDANDLVTIPPLCRDMWRIAMMSPQSQLVNPFFVATGETINVSFPTSTMPHEAKLMSLRGNNVHFARATVFHELIPGHHLQGYMSARHKPYRSLFSTPFSVEGWALYWELLLWDRGFARSPEDKIGVLFWRMHRCARIIFSLKFHLGEMSAQECIEFLVGRVGHERDNATAEVRRSLAGNYGPLYQAAYLLGGFQFRALHRELVESGKMTDRAFHDAILKMNRIPVAMVRTLLTDDDLRRDRTPRWKFSEVEAGP